MKRKNRGRRKLLVGLIFAEVVVAAALAAFLWYMKNRTVEFDWEQYPVLTHAMGAVDEKTFLNCREGFQMYYDQGCRMFEVDLAETSDGEWVCRHGWSSARGQWKKGEKKVLTLDEFLAKPYFKKYTPMSLESFLLVLKKYPDAYAVLDSKKYSKRDHENTVSDFSAYLETARAAGCEEVLDRLIPEVYNQEMYEALVSLYEFPTYVYALWQEYSLEELKETAQFCHEKKIPIATISEEYWTEEIQRLFDEQDVLLCVYTVNDLSRARQLMEAGAASICSDTILPDQLKKKKDSLQ